jgi:KDO2-lipid IV(A) lauroyltransferase
MLKGLLKVLLKFVSVLPMSAIRGLGRVVGFFYGSVLRYHRADAFVALKRSLPGKSPKEYRQIIQKMYAWQGIYLMESIHYFIKGPAAVKPVIDVEGEEHLKKALQREKGAVILTAHFGNFDIMPLITVAHGYKLTVITKEIRNETINDLWMDVRAADGLSFVPAHNSFRDCLKALRRNELVGFVFDQNMKRGEGIFVDYFGKPASTTPGLAYMSAQAKAPVVPVFIYPKGKHRHIMRVLPAIEPPENRKPESIEQATLHYNRVLEDVVREDPEQWIWMHRRWKTQAKK